MADAPDPVNIAVIASAVCGSVVIIAAIIVIVCIIGFCYERLRSAPDTRSRTENHQPHHHNRRRRRRRGHAEESGEGVDPHEDVHLEDSELQPHPPPPSYSRVHQYSSIDAELNVVTQQGEENGTTRVSMFIGDEEEITQDQDSPTNNGEVVAQTSPPQQDTLPPTYSTAQLELMTVQRGSAGIEGGHGAGNLAAREEAISQSRSAEGEGSLPPSYSTARMELMRIKAQSSMEERVTSDNS